MNGPAINLIDNQNPSATYDDLLNKSINFVLREYPRNISSFSNFQSIFHGLIQNSQDPPLEIIWFYLAVTFQGTKAASLPPKRKLVLAKEMFHWLDSHSCSYSVVKKVAVIAPVLYILYHLVLDFSERDPSLREGIGILVEEIASYISICCSHYLEGGEQGSDRLGPRMLGLIRVWTVDQITQSHETDLLAFFFPNLNNDFQQEVIVRMRYMSAVVMNEAFLLRLSLKVSAEIRKEDLQKNILSFTIQTMKGFQNFYFLDMLFKMMLEPSLPVASLLSSEDADILYEALYDAILLVDYAFYSGRWAQSNDPYSRKLAVLWLLVANRATQFARAKNDQDRASLYLNAFNESSLIAGLIRWASTQDGVGDQNIRPDVTTPNALIEWLFMLEVHGVTVFEEDVSLWYAKAISKGDVVAPEVQLLGSNEVDLMNVENDITRKRKEPAGDTETRLRQAKRVVSISEVRYGTEVVNVSSDDEMES